MALKILNFINNEFCPAASHLMLEKNSPATGRLVGEFARSSKEDVQRATAAARAAFPAWSLMTAVNRGEILFKFAALLEARRQEIAKVTSLETGKPVRDAMGEVGAAIAQARFMAGEGARFGGRVIPSSIPGKTVMVTREPMGVAALLVASNTPVPNVAWKIFPALVCGNAVVLKSSEDTPACANVFGEIAIEAGLPPGVLNIVHGSGIEAGAELVSDAEVDVVSFTGSTAVGKAISKSLGGKLTKVFLELGGKNPFVVCDDANMSDAIEWAVKSAFSNAGQRCAAASRIIVFDSVYDSFVERLVSRAKALKVGTGGDGEDLGPVINARAIERLEDAVESVRAADGRILCGGYRLTDGQLKHGFYFAPTVVDNIGPGHDVSRNELFGPLVACYRAHDLEHAIQLANDCDYGLTSAIHTQDLDRAFEFARRMEAGVVTVNGGTHGSEPHFPFGGVKDSGNGAREPGVEALDVYSTTKNLCILRN